MSETLNYTLVESIEDLQCLSRGDLVKMIFQCEPAWKYGRENERDCIYYGLAHNGALKFITPRRSENCLSIFRARKSTIQFENGKIIMNENYCVQETLSPTKIGYDTYNEFLISRGF